MSTKKKITEFLSSKEKQYKELSECNFNFEPKTNRSHTGFDISEDISPLRHISSKETN